MMLVVPCFGTITAIYTTGSTPCRLRNAWDYTQHPAGYDGTAEKTNRQRDVIRAMSALQAGIESDASNLNHLKSIPQVKRLLDNGVIRGATGYQRVIIVRHSPPSFNTVKLFNLFSTCGQIERIKIFRESSSTALLQFTDSVYAALAITYFQGCRLEAGRQDEIRIEFSKCTEILTSPGEHDSHQTQIFRNNDQRYPKKEDLYLKQACCPTNTVYIDPLPVSMKDQEIVEMLAKQSDFEVHPMDIVRVRVRDQKMSVLLKFRTVVEAINVLVNCHNLELTSPKVSLRISFSRRFSKASQNTAIDKQ
eukprot:GHVH01006993.1.p1 GENE.GHVH01006993.1~~GHVH01006993.1.p1  ORF type:complete len:306 (+),score=21.70 GHVH01006993.1:596-1513(+)